MKSINFEEIKEILLTETDLTPYLTSGENAKKGLLLFWALDSLSGKTTNQNFMNNAKTLKEIQRKVCYEDGLSTSLKMYSHEFILGVLEFTSRSIEANIEKYTPNLGRNWVSRMKVSRNCTMKPFNRFWRLETGRKLN
ncbi:MAG: hypothetical protein ACXAB2_03630 [Candidatus Hodarchaeales archaeon]